MKIKANANGTSLGMSGKAKIDRMDCAGAADEDKMAKLNDRYQTLIS